jgi:site-specific recombinase XerD
MASPTKRKGSDNWYYRRAIPANLQRILAALPKSQRPANWYKTQIWISLGTADRLAAKAKYAEIAAQVERQMQALREGPKALTQKQITALAGELYRAIADGLEAEPVLSPEQWRDIAEGNRAARNGGHMLGIYKDHGERRATAMEQRFGRLADALLAKHNLVTDDASRWKLIERLSIDMPQAAEKLARNADGDFSPDAYAQRFPPLERPTDRPTTTGKLTELAEAWRQAALARGLTKRDARKMSMVMLRFAAWLDHDDASRVTYADVVRWVDERSQQGISAVTINKTDLPALRVIFKWGKPRGWVTKNPTLDDEGQPLRIEGRGKPKVREKYFTEAEIVTILTAARSVKRSTREDPKTTAAKHWVPWLSAYSGVRVTEMIQIRKQDVRQERGAWIVRLTPEAGSIKNNEFRDVPVHEHLIELGFIDFVKAAPNGYLFCNVADDGTIAGPAEGVYSRIWEFIRTVLTDPNVQPTHAWRYTFKTRGLEADIEPLVLDAICGHAPRTKGADYTKVTLKKRIAAMNRFPRYDMRPDLVAHMPGGRRPKRGRNIPLAQAAE